MGLMPGSDKKVAGPVYDPAADAAKEAADPVLQGQELAKKNAEKAAKHLAGIGEQAAVAKKAVGVWDQQASALSGKEDADRLAIRRQAAAALAGMQGRNVGSGVGLAAMRSTALDRSAQENQLSKDYDSRLADIAARRLEAEGNATAAQTAYDEAVLQSGQQEQASIYNASARVDSVFSSTKSNASWYEGGYTDADAAKAAERSVNEVLSTLVPGSAAYNAAMEAINRNYREETGKDYPFAR